MITDTIVRSLLIESRFVPAYRCTIDDTKLDDGLPWYHDIYHFLRLDAYPETATAKDKREMRQLATRFMICGETLLITTKKCYFVDLIIMVLSTFE